MGRDAHTGAFSFWVRNFESTKYLGRDAPAGNDSVFVGGISGGVAPTRGRCARQNDFGLLRLGQTLQERAAHPKPISHQYVGTMHWLTEYICLLYHLLT